MLPADAHWYSTAFSQVELYEESIWTADVEVVAKKKGAEIRAHACPNVLADACR